MVLSEVNRQSECRSVRNVGTLRLVSISIVVVRSDKVTGKLAPLFEDPKDEPRTADERQFLCRGSKMVVRDRHSALSVQAMYILTYHEPVSSVLRAGIHFKGKTC